VATLGESIKSRRDALELTQEQLAAATDNDVTTSALGKIERSETKNPNRSTLRAIAKALGIIEKYLFDLAEGRIDVLPKDAFRSPQVGTGITPVGGYARGVPEQLLRHPNISRWAPVVNSTPGGQSQDYPDPYSNTGHAGQYLPLPPDAIPDGDLFFVKIVGDSMREFIRSGDWALCTPNSRFIEGAIYCVQFDGEKSNGNCLKFVFKRDGEHYELRPGNPRFNSEIVRIESVALAMVVGIYRSAKEILSR